MSTTDTRAAFEALPENGKLNFSKVPDGSEYISFYTQLAWRDYQSATEAAKATGTAGEWVQCKPGSPEFYWKEQVEAARQPAPVAVKTWQEHFTVKSRNRGMPELLRIHLERNCMMDEIADLRAALAATVAPVAATQHPDDIAVDKFAVAMKGKMAVSRTKGRGGWENPEECDIEDLACMLIQHVEKGDPVDIGNFCMMVWNRVRGTGPDTYAPIVEAFLSYAGDASKTKLVVGDIETAKESST